MLISIASKLSLLLILLCSFNSYSNDLKDFVESSSRNEANVLRDVYRNPLETLSFFGLESDMTVVELSPGGGWYTEILAPYLKDSGDLIVAHFNPDLGGYYERSRSRFEKKIRDNEIYEAMTIVDLDSQFSKPGEADAVLTFRNLHNWIGPQLDVILNSAYLSLKSGGILGVVEHRAEPGTSIESMKKTGYVTEEWAISEVEKKGFVLLARSELNANPRDTKNHPRGVWTLPPSMAMKEQDKKKYEAIGESDRMTLLFKKP
tara:strand:+ start:2108 stop:2890 length:783 start_codon:yes stop_codon:yes gene_type:complete